MSETLYCISFVAYPSMEIEHVVINTFSHSPNIMQSSFVPDIQKRERLTCVGCQGTCGGKRAREGKTILPLIRTKAREELRKRRSPHHKNKMFTILSDFTSSTVTYRTLYNCK